MILRDIVFKPDMINLTKDDRVTILKLAEATVPDDINEFEY